MERPVPPLTRNPCNSRTKLDFSAFVRMRTPARVGGHRPIAAVIFPQLAITTPDCSRRRPRNVATASRLVQARPVKARQKLQVVNP
jgi:hypothetical protein